MSDDQLQPSDTLDDRGVDDVLDEGYSPPDRESANMRHFGEEESLEDRLDDEEPEVWANEPDPEEDPAQVIRDGDVGGEVGSARTGRLMAEDEGSREDTQSDLVAEDEGIDGAGASAEEAAMHTIDDPQ